MAVITEAFHEINSRFTLAKLKEYISILAAISTFLGGSWQFFKLYSIDLTMLRFFSVGQLIADGILVMIPISVTMGVFLFLFLMSKFCDRPTKLHRRILMVQAVAFLTVLTHYSMKQFLPSEKYLSHGLIISVIIIIFISVIELAYSGETLNNTNSRKKFVKILIATSGIIAFVNFVVTTNVYSDNLTFQKTITAVKQETNADNVKLLYFNDQYLFFEVKYGKTTRTYIKKHDFLFEQN